MQIKRVFLIVLDSFGIGNAPDAEIFGDAGSNTLATVMKSSRYHTPNLKKLGLFNIDGVQSTSKAETVIGSYGRLQEASKGKDTTVGHWEMAGIISKQALPTYPLGFPEEIINEFSRRTKRGVLCNKPYSGTEVLHDYGKKHMETGDLVVYTSADSVFQIAAHEDVVPLEQLYEYCEIARELLRGEHGVGRVIARPFIGTEDNYQRTSNRHDYSLEPTGTTMMDVLVGNGLTVKGVGKIYDIFAGQSIETTVSTRNNADGMEQVLHIQKEVFEGLCFANLVDFDMVYGHRRDIDGYANALTEFDEQLGVFMEQMQPDDVLMITADHGCDPGYQGSDHTRECVPVLLYGESIKSGVSLGTRNSFSDIAATILESFSLSGDIAGNSFWNDVNDDV